MFVRMQIETMKASPLVMSYLTWMKLTLNYRSVYSILLRDYITLFCLIKDKTADVILYNILLYIFSLSGL